MISISIVFKKIPHLHTVIDTDKTVLYVKISMKKTECPE